MTEKQPEKCPYCHARGKRRRLDTHNERVTALVFRGGNVAKPRIQFGVRSQRGGFECGDVTINYCPMCGVDLRRHDDGE